ncbi:MAG: Lrp/AsnC family transcriptional regulator [Alphaproteobacteria bacterium]|nr:AsnC family transcriptional regulator [Alphaproteobacteria bacterium]|tara:strand:+ start:307 stop:777 length:471 start_codon:yes stop_codon:yes gene_type:complete
MDDIDRKICEIMQHDGRTSSAAIAEALSIPTSTANDRLRKLSANGTIRGWHAALDPEHAGASLACFVLIDMDYTGESEAVGILCTRPEVMELHHISGAHSYLMKLRIEGMQALETFLTDIVKPISAIRRTETIFAMKTYKETSEILITSVVEKGLK